MNDQVVQMLVAEEERIGRPVRFLGYVEQQVVDSRGENHRIELLTYETAPLTFNGSTIYESRFTLLINGVTYHGGVLD